MLRGLLSKVTALLRGAAAVDEELFEQLEETLIEGDVNIVTAAELVDKVRSFSRKEKTNDPLSLEATLKQEIATILSQGERNLQLSEKSPSVFLFVGVNGTGKTTTIAKVAHRFQNMGKRVLLCAADTFRAAAIEQLQEWGRRLNADVIAQSPGSDAGAVVFDSLRAALARKIDLVLIDTAGRQHTKRNLMDELAKIGRVIEREVKRPPDETLLVLDATTGQNAFRQAEEFKQFVPVSGIALAKMDSSAKGGIVISVVQRLEIPVKLLGVGEKLENLIDFEPEEFVQALFD